MCRRCFFPLLTNQSTVLGPSPSYQMTAMLINESFFFFFARGYSICQREIMLILLFFVKSSDACHFVVPPATKKKSNNCKTLISTIADSPHVPSIYFFFTGWTWIYFLQQQKYHHRLAVIVSASADQILRPFYEVHTARSSYIIKLLYS